MTKQKEVAFLYKQPLFVISMFSFKVFPTHSYQLKSPVKGLQVCHT